MSKEAKISVIVPVYGVEKYIERCAISLFEQTLDDIEYIFVNDCTPDCSIEILKDVLDRYPNRVSQVRILNMPRNSGQAAVRKFGVENAIGEYIIHCDSDDWLSVNAYEKLYICAKHNNSDIVFCDFYRSDGKCDSLIHRSIDTSSKMNVIKTVSINVGWSLCGALVKRDIIFENNIIYPTQNNGEDFALMFQLIYYSQSYYKIDEPLYYYYRNPESITNESTEEGFFNRYLQLKQNTELVINFIKKHTNEVYFQKLIVCYKLFCRSKISPLTGQDKYKQIWNCVYPDLKFKDILLNDFIPLRSKLNYIAVKLNIYKIICNNIRFIVIIAISFGL